MEKTINRKRAKIMNLKKVDPKFYPKHPIYIVSKGRSEFMKTSISLTKMGVSHFIVVEPSEAELYRESVKKMQLLAEILELDMNFKEVYSKCDDLGMTRSTGPGPARNFAWNHSIFTQKAKWHWVMDDNILGFFRLNNNLKVPCGSPAFWRAMEDFCERYENVAMAGPNYFFFAPRKTVQPPFVLNTRIYSCNLIRNDAPFEWRGRYNEDTILSLDMLSNNWVTVQFNAFLQDKMETQSQKGGNTKEFYHAEGTKESEKDRYAKNGTLAKSQMIVDVYPRISRLSEKFGRIHHYVDYSGFKTKLKRRDDFEETVSNDINNYNMEMLVNPDYKPRNI